MFQSKVSLRCVETVQEQNRRSTYAATLLPRCLSWQVFEIVEMICSLLWAFMVNVLNKQEHNNLRGGKNQLTMWPSSHQHHRFAGKRSVFRVLLKCWVVVSFKISVCVWDAEVVWHTVLSHRSESTGSRVKAQDHAWVTTDSALCQSKLHIQSLCGSWSLFQNSIFELISQKGNHQAVEEMKNVITVLHEVFSTSNKALKTLTELPVRDLANFSVL